jgi:hypothetical protein
MSDRKPQGLFTGLSQAELIHLSAMLGRLHVRANRAYQTRQDYGLALIRGEAFDVLAADVLPLISAGEQR